MDTRNFKVDAKTITFHGISTRGQRNIALLTTLLIWVGSGFALLNLALLLNAYDVADQAGLFLASALLIHYTLTGRFVFLSIAQWLCRTTPIGVLYRKDMSVLSAAREQLLAVANRVSFADFQSYSRINPLVESPGAATVIEHQNAGDLKHWVADVQNLKVLANLVYQLTLVAQKIASGVYPRP